MNKNEFARRLLTYISSSLLNSRKRLIKEKTLLFEEGIIDSMKIIELIEYIEKTLDIKVTEDKISMEYHNNLSSLNNLEIKKKLEGAGFFVKIVDLDKYIGYIYAWK